MAFRNSKVKNKMKKRNSAKLKYTEKTVFNMPHIQAINPSGASFSFL